MQTTKKAAASTSSDSSIELLMTDHRNVRKLFAEFKKVKDEDDDSAKLSLVQQICKALLVHAQLEEEIFYPMVRAEISDEDLMDEAAVEHASAKELIMQLLAMRPGDDMYNAKVTVLSEMIEHHVKEEEGEMFPQAKKAKVLTELLAEQMVQRQQELLTEVDAAVGKVKRSTPDRKKSTSAQATAH